MFLENAALKIVGPSLEKLSKYRIRFQNLLMIAFRKYPTKAIDAVDLSTVSY